LPRPLDVVPAYRKVEGGDHAGAIADLRARRRDLVTELDRQLTDMAGVLERVTPRVEALATSR